MKAPPGGLGPPPRGNPGSTTQIYLDHAPLGLSDPFTLGYMQKMPRKLFAVAKLEVSRTQCRSNWMEVS